MKLFRIRFDGTDDFVEAPGFQAAITLWKKWAMSNDGGRAEDWDNPEEIQLVTTESIIRLGELDGDDAAGWCENAERCGNVATKMDAQGVGLCRGCFAGLEDDAAKKDGGGA